MTYNRKEVIGDCTLYLGDCLDILPTLPRVDAVVTDPPYGITRCKWDIPVDYEKMWNSLSSVREKETPVLIFGAEPFSSQLRLSNLKEFKYDWVWFNPKGTGYLNARKQPLRNHQNISVFYRKQCTYYPQKTKTNVRKVSVRGPHLQSDVYGKQTGNKYDSTERYPQSVIVFSSDTQNSSEHPTQKPVGLISYLLQTYSTPAQTILDPFMGSGTTGVACVKLGRKFIGIEIEPKYFDIACKRIEDAYKQGDFFVERPKAEQSALMDLPKQKRVAK